MGRFSRRREEAERLTAEIAALRLQLDSIGARLDGIVESGGRESKRIDEITARSSDVDARIAQIGTEVTHQLGELSTDIERLAQEQARYQIAFRQDLAEVAELAKKKND